ncbi:MAG: SMC family ATPase [archaeon]
MIKKIRLYNWKSHRNSELEFSKGTNVLTGIIGAGKSTVIEAMCFALFGTYPALNSKSVSLNEIIMNKPNQMDESKVELEFDYNSKNYLVKRTVFLGKNANQAKLLEDGKLIAGPKPSDVNEKIEEILEINYDLFSRAVYSEQNQIDFFLKLSPMQRKNKFDEILGLDRYEKARKTSVSAINRIKRMAEDRKDLIKKNSELIDENMLKELEEIKKEKEKEISNLREKNSEEKEELEKALKELLSLEGKEKKFTKLKEKEIELKSKLSEAEKKLGQKKSELEKTGTEEEKERLKELKKQKTELEKISKEISVLEAGIKAEKEKLEFLEKEKNRKKDSLKGIDSAEKIMEKISEMENREKKLSEALKQAKEEAEAKEKELNEMGNGFSVNAKKIDELEENIRKLSKPGADCPVCSTKLSKEKKLEVINSYEKEQARIRIINKGLSEDEKKIAFEVKTKKDTAKEKETEIKKLGEEKNTVDSLKEKISEIEETEKEEEKCIKKISEKDSLKKKLETGFSGKKPEELEEKIKKTEETIELLNELARYIQWKKELEKTSEEKSLLDYRENSFSEKKEAVSAKKSSVEFIEKEIKTKNELIESIKSNIERIEKEKKKIKELIEEVEKQEKMVSGMALFNNALNETQSELRKEMIDTINDAMDDVWNRVYPYGDFTSAKMEIEEGNYEIKVKEKNGKWTRVEGILSGGERSAAAICIRTAFSLVLTQNLSWLILDEPTHNLDKNAVIKLSAMMKEHLPSLVDQIFLITHDPEMEKAASGDCYEIERDKENEGSSIPKKNSIN